MPASAARGGLSGPTRPGSLKIRSVSATVIHVSWAASHSNVRVTGYRIYVNRVLRAFVRSRSFRIRRLRCGTKYVLAVRAYDSVGRRSSPRRRTVKTLRCAPGRKAPQRCTKTTAVGTGLASVIASAARGSVVCLSGGDYGHVAIRNIHKAKTVVVRPVTGASASVDLELVASSGLRLVGLTISDLLMANSANVTLSHNTFTGMSLVQTQRVHANILFDSNRLDGNNAGPNDYEGRLTIRGYDNTQPVGVTISNNHFGGGCSDGVQVIGDAYGVRIGPGNKFTGLRQGGCAAHVDPIQLYGARHVVVRGNYFHDNGDGTGGLESFDGDDYGTVTNNVFVCTCIYPYSVAASGGDNWVVKHNTFAGGGYVSFANANDGETASGNLVRDNVFTSGGGISARGSTWGTNDHNLNAGVPGPGNLKGTPVFVGGKKPKSYQGYRLARGSPGKGAASDGGDLGILARR
jgi:hypothetical protein